MYRAKPSILLNTTLTVAAENNNTIAQKMVSKGSSKM